MTFHVLEIKRPSGTVISKMRNGKPVRISAGTGFPIVVHSDRLKEIGNKFSKGAAHTVALTKEELNKNYEHLAGEGIFGKKFDQTLEKHGVKKLAYHLADMAKPVVKGGIDTLAGMASVAQPELAPLAMGAAYLANDYLDNPNSYTHETVKQKAQQEAGNYLNDQFGTNYGNNLQATMNNLSANSLQSQINKDNAIAAATSYITPIVTQGLSGPQTLQSVMSVPTVLPQTNTRPARGRGLYVNMGARGDGLFASASPMGDGLKHVQGDLTPHLLALGARTFRGHGLHAARAGKVYEKASVMVGGNLLDNTQAVSSQPYMDYFMQSSFVPASARKFRTTVSDWTKS